MAKITLNDTAGGYNITTINENFEKIENELNNKVLYRDNPVGEPNQLNSDIDVNGKKLYNLPAPTLPSQAARLQDVVNAVAGIVPANMVPFSPAGTIEATNVQGAIEELDTKTTYPAFIDTLLDDTSASAFRTTLGAAASTTLSKIVSLEDEQFTALFSGGDHTPGLVSAVSQARIVLIPNTRTWSFTGSIPIASGCTILFVGNPTINLVVDNDNRGFYFPDGTSNANIFGNATINLTVNTAGSDGSFNGAFTFGTFYFSTDAVGIKNCKVQGNILVNCLGPANGKPVSIYGYSEHIEIDGVQGTGQTNYTFSAHWSGNGSVGVLPTKTWHPHNIKFKNCKSYVTSGSTLRSFTASACGTIVYEDCVSYDVTTVNFNIFVGDYGYTYAQNINSNQAFNTFISRCATTGVGIGITVDGQTSGLNSSPIWTASDYSTSINIDGLDILIGAGATNTVGAAFSFVGELNANDLKIKELGTSNATQTLTIFGVRDGYINGDNLTRFGALVRASRDISLDLQSITPLEEPDQARYGVSASATSTTCTVYSSILAGDTSITLVGNTLVTGPGGYLRYNDGVTTHEIDILTSTYTSGNQTITISPSPVAIPGAASVTVIQTVKSLRVGSKVLTGYASGVRTTGSSTAKVRNVFLDGTRFNRCGIYDVDFSAVAGVRVDGTFHDNGGQRTTTTNRRCISFGSNAEGFLVCNSHFGKNNTRIQYLVYIDNSATRGLVASNLFESINSSASNPAAIFKNTATEITIGTNRTVTGVTAVYP